MAKSNDIFEAIRRKVISVAECDTVQEVTNKTDFCFGGIYMLYVDDFSDDKVVPFYIGQTTDFQRRHKQHFSELLELNRYNYDDYRRDFMRPSYHFGVSCAFDGHFKMCKVFKYMLEHGCKLQDFHMIILERQDNIELLDELEQRYFQEFEPAFFGFNQMNTVTEWKKYGEQDFDKYLAFVEEDGKKCDDRIDYGYTLFNYLHAYPKSPASNYPPSLNDVIRFLNAKFYDQKQFDEIEEMYNKANESVSELAGTKKDFKTQIVAFFELFFTENGLKSTDKLELAVELALEPNDKKMAQLRQYVSRYSKVKSATIDSVYGISAIKEYRNRYAQAKESSEKLQLAYFEKKHAFCCQKYQLIFPCNRFDSFVLGDIYSPYMFPNVDLDNVCQINIEYTCERTNIYRDIYPEEMYIAFRYINKGVVLENIYSLPYSYSDISVNMEYKTGLNEAVIAKIQEIRIDQFFKKVSKLINSETTVLIYSRTSGWKNKVKQLMNRVDIQGSLLREKIQHAIR